MLRVDFGILVASVPWSLHTFYFSLSVHIFVIDCDPYLAFIEEVDYFISFRYSKKDNVY